MKSRKSNKLQPRFRPGDIVPCWDNNKLQPRFRPGDIVACWDRREIDGKEIRKPIIGWIESIHSSNTIDGIVYNVRWSDRLEQEKIMRVAEDQMPPLRNLVDMIRAGEIK